MKYKEEFMIIVDDIINHHQFKQLKTMSHHGINRYDHCLSVAYHAYKMAKRLKLDYFQVARGALLHDFFESPEGNDLVTRFNSVLNHPDIALQNANNNFELGDKEVDIIATHMFPFGKYIPKCGESWLVNTVDKILSVGEVSYVAIYKMNYASSVLKLFLINLLR